MKLRSALFALILATAPLITFSGEEPAGGTPSGTGEPPATPAGGSPVGGLTAGGLAGVATVVVVTAVAIGAANNDNNTFTTGSGTR